MIKSGLFTTEFALTVITIAGTIYSAVAGFIPADLMVKITVIATGVYSIARAISKMTPSKKDDEIIAKIEEVFGKKEEIK